MTTKAIRKELTDYMQKASPQKLKAIYTLVQHDIVELEESDIDDELMAELNKRSAEMERGVNVMTAAESDEDIKKLFSSFKK